MNISGNTPPGAGEPPGIHDIIDVEGTEDYSDFMQSIAREIVQRQLTVPAIIFLESIKPLSFLGNQLLIFANPLVSLVVRTGNYYKFVRMIEDRENVEKLTVAIEEENAKEVHRRRRLKEEKRRQGGGFFRKLFRRKKKDHSNKEVDSGGR